MADPRETNDEVADALLRLRRPIALTRMSLTVDRAARAFWPLMTVSCLAIAAVRFGAISAAPQISAAVGTVGLLAAGLWGARKFRMPSRTDAIAALESRLPNRPISGLTDDLALGGADDAVAALWQVHRRRLARRALAAKAPMPSANLAPRDPFALRLTGLTALCIAILFGGQGGVFSDHTVLPLGGPAQAAMGPSWEGWAEPPRYTGKPGLYLNALKDDTLELPEGTVFSFRFYGDQAASPLTETVSGETPQDASSAATGERREFTAETSGQIVLEGAFGRRFEITLLADDAPEVSLLSPATRRADGRLSQPFSASDDYGVNEGRAQITLDLASVDRRFGLTVAPESRPDLVFDLPMPISGSRVAFTETLVEDAAKHPWANLPVTVTVEVQDGRGQFGRAPVQQMELPGRRFFDPLAAAFIEVRRDLLWSAQNAARSLQILRAINHRSEQVIANDEVAELLPAVIDRLQGGITAVSASAGADIAIEPALRDDLADVLWQMAELLEDGGLADALAAMQQAQQRLSEAIRNGASKDEIAKLMAELKEATDNYMRQLAQQSEQQDQGPQFGQQQEAQQITGDQIQQMMDQIQKLMEEGRMSEAQEMLDQLAKLMENLEIQQGQGGEGDMPGGQAMEDLAETLKDQQELSDEAFRELQKEFDRQQGDPRADAPSQGGETGGGQQDGTTPPLRDLPYDEDTPQGGGEDGGAPQQGDPNGGEGSSDEGQSLDQLAERQRDLRRELGRQQGLLPRPGNEAGEEARRRLDDAGRAMERAEEALREGDSAGAISRQADAIEALREGMRSFQRAMGATPDAPEGEERDDSQMGQGGGQSGNQTPRDPLGRNQGSGEQLGTNESLLGENDAGKRAQDLLEELRRRSGERLRPDEELDYFQRLLDQF
ncbi:DUF4175 domain-containing protein [Albirhodobacter sp. R86504]|uniref:DUF4175 domain-containing protein n=1 Tax=Albirhodobacter sp. R86504 TaxID=3093848 RepID=UPI00366D59BF